MPESIAVGFDVRLGSGPSWTIVRQVAVDAIDVVDVDVPMSASDVRVPIQPGGNVRLILIVADPASDTLSYKTSASGSDHLLDQPHLLFGAGAVGMLEGAAPPKFLFVTNSGATDVRVTIVVGRDLA